MLFIVVLCMKCDFLAPKRHTRFIGVSRINGGPDIAYEFMEAFEHYGETSSNGSENIGRKAYNFIHINMSMARKYNV